MRLRFVCTLAIVVLPLTARSAELREHVEAVAKPFLDGKKNLALVVGVVTPAGSNVYGFGTVKVGGREQAPDGTTVYEIGSITKAYTGVLLAVLQRDGVVQHDHPAQRYLPADLTLPRNGERPITLQDLATHASGLPRMPSGFGFRIFAQSPKDWNNPYARYTRAELVKDLAGLKLECAPGAKFEYSNLGMGVLGVALAQAAQAESFEAALTRHVLNPLGLSDTRITLTAGQQARLTPVYDKSGERLPVWEFAELHGCGALKSTARDQLAFLAAHLGLRPTPLAAALNDAATPRRDAARPGQQVGLGWHVQPLRPDGPRLVWHNGGTFGSHSFAGFVAHAKVGVVVLGNTGHSVDRVAIDLLRRLCPE